MTRTKEEIRTFLEEEIKGLTKEEAIDILETRKFYIDMRDHWDEEDEKWWDVITTMIMELEKKEGNK